MAGRRYAQVRFVEEFTNAFGSTYRVYQDASGSQTSVCVNSIFCTLTPQQAAVKARRRLGRERAERRRWRRFR